MAPYTTGMGVMMTSRGIAKFLFLLFAVIAVRAQTFTTLATFNGSTGSEPFGLMQATDGKFYGVTMFGGANSVGTIFNITPGAPLTTLYSFCPQAGCSDGGIPQAALVEGANGDLYGTTTSFGTSNGTVFKIAPGGTLSTLHSFNGTDGEVV